MAPKKNAKRVIQVPEEDEPPAKKLQTTLKRHGVSGSSHRLVADVFSHPAAAGLSQDSKEMFLAMLPHSLCTACDERDEFQLAGVEMLEKVISQLLAGMQESLDLENEKVQAMDAEKEQLELAVQNAQEELSLAQARTSEKQSTLTNAAAACAAAKARLKSAEDADAAQQLTTTAASEDKEKLQQAVASTGSFARLKNGDWDDGEADQLFNLLEPLVLQKLTTDSSLKTAMRCTLVKKPSNRGPFDAVVLEELDRAFATRISLLEKDLESAAPLAAECAAAVAAAASELEAAKAAEKEASSALTTSCTAESTPAAAVQAAKAALTEFRPKHLQACSKRNNEQRQLQNFVDLNVAAFHELRDRVSPKRLKELAAKAAKEEAEKAAEKEAEKAQVQTEMAIGEPDAAAKPAAGQQEDSKLVAHAEAIAASMLSPRAEGGLGGPEVGGA